MTTETDIETRVREWRYAYFQGLCRESTYDLTDHVLAEFRRLRQRISELEYRERSRECVGGTKEAAHPAHMVDTATVCAFLCEHCANGTIRGSKSGADGEFRDYHYLPGGKSALCTAAEFRRKIIQQAIDNEDFVSECREAAAEARSARPDAVQILREKQKRHQRFAEKCMDGRIATAVASALGEVADAMEKGQIK